MWARFCQKKMAGHRRLIGLLTVLGVLLLGAGAQQTEVKLVGSEVIMVPKYTGNPTEINWKINGNKLVDMELNTPDEPTFYHLKNRTTIDRTNGRLTIRNLTIGDSGDYKAEVLVNSVYQYTEIKLTVRACPDVPTITDQSTKDRIILFCESSTPGVTYEWRINKISVGTNQLYNESRPKEDVTLTCFVDNEVCKKNVSKTILYTAEPSGPSGGGIAGIVFVVIIVIVICLLLLLYFSRDEPRVVDCVRRVRKRMPWCKGNSTDVEGQPLLAQSQQVKMVGSDLILDAQYIGDPSEINWKINDKKLVNMNLISPVDPIFYSLKGRATIDETNGRLTIRGLTIEDSGIYRAEALVKDGHQITEITLTVRESSGCITVKFPEDQPKGKVNPGLTIHNVKPEDHGQYVLEVLQSNGEKHELKIKGQSQVKLVGSEVTLEPQYRGDPSEINWKIDGNKLVDLELNTLDDPTFYRLGDRATIDGANGRLTIRGLTIGDSGDYKAEVLVNNVYQYTEITLAVRETDGIVIIGTEDDKVTLAVPDTEKVTKITLKKGGVTLFQWKVSDLKLHTNNITLEPGFVTVNNVEGNRSYKVEVHSTDNSITNHKLLEGNESPTNREAAETTPLAENGRSESQPIDSVTFHPINMTNKITWKKDGQPVNIDGKRMKSGPYGDLIINNVTPGDKGKYSVQCEDQKLAQEFILHL
ncbi:uncharacterized protein LOC120921625 isoform X2 [Rana temporaria]|uniref:uncharacterized protein LOC120921625 isoform X2 n=1 Tax=Rana temporaria TaxID=8407 RepID=UPI001AADE077|nr:uncharacterized protein LOC120921625 isoform X2 [Rana temporaria]